MRLLHYTKFLACFLAVLNGVLAQEDAQDSTGFVPIFDGSSLSGWRADPASQAAAWSIKDGVIRGEGQEDRLAYLVYSGDEQLKDFELRFQYRMVTDGNTGVEIRARVDETGKRPFEGYHADLGHVGIGAGVLGAWDFHFGKDTRKEFPCERGTRLVIDEDGRGEHQRIDGAVQLDNIKKRDWNRCRIVARGRDFQFYINGKLASEFSDHIRDGHLESGFIGLQLHDKGMIVEFKEIELKKLAATGTGDLPQGDGIAAAFKADAGISGHESVIYANGFEQGEAWKDHWDEARDKDGKVLELVAPPGDDPKFGKRSLQVTATLGENTGGGATKWFESAEALFIRFYARFDKDCDYVHHFVTLRANKRAARQATAGAASAAPASNRTATSASRPPSNPGATGGATRHPGKWNFYSYWHEMKATPDKKYWGNQFKPDEQAGHRARANGSAAEFMIKHNTPGQAGRRAGVLDRRRAPRPLEQHQLAHHPRAHGQRPHPRKLRHRPLDEEPEQHRLLRQPRHRQTVHRSGEIGSAAGLETHVPSTVNRGAREASGLTATSARRYGSQMMRILITGATGKVGTAFIAACRNRPEIRLRAFCHQRLLVEDPQLEVVRGSIAVREDVRRAMEGVTHVVHLATCKETPDDVMDVTVKGLFWLLEESRSSPSFQQFILIGGDASMGHFFYPHPIPVTEEQAHSAYPGCYALSKVLEEVMLKQYYTQYGLSGCCLRAPWIMEKDDFRFSLSFGDDAFGGPRWADLVPAEKVAEYRDSQAVPIMMDPDGRAVKRNFVHVDDLVAAILAAIEQPEAAHQQLFNVCMDEPLDYRAVAAHLAETRGLPTSRCRPLSQHLAGQQQGKFLLGWRPEGRRLKLADLAWDYQRAAGDERKVWYPG